MDKFRNLVLYLLGLSLPLIFLPGIFANTFALPKFIFLIMVIFFLLLIWTLQIYQENRLTWHSTPFDLPIIFLGFAYLISSLRSPTNKILELTSLSGSGAIILLILLFFLIVQTEKTPQKNETSLPIKGLVHSGIILALWVIINFAIELFKISFSIPYLNFSLPATNLSPTGSLLAQATFLLIILIYIGLNYLKDKKPVENSYINILSGLSSLILIFIGLIFTVYKLNKATILPLLPSSAGWAIAVETIKNNPLFGVGPDQFFYAFTRFKPIMINQAKYWNTTFSLSSNWYLHLLTTTGFFGLFAYLFLIWKVWRAKKSSSIKKTAVKNPFWLILVIIFIIQFFVPFTFTLLFLEFIFLTVLGLPHSTPTTTIHLVTIKEDFIEEETDKTTIREYWKEVEVD